VVLQSEGSLLDQGPIDLGVSTGAHSRLMPQFPLTISVVDDEAPVRKALGRLLRAAGFDVTTFASGREFLDSLNTRRPDCTIMDLHLPELSGLDVQQQLVRDEVSLPCIVITGKDEPGVAERVLASGAAAYLKKPLDELALLSAISSAVPKHFPEQLPNEKIPARGRTGLCDKPSVDGDENEPGLKQRDPSWAASPTGTS
jgi:CheY-like chemotaxis protein